MIKQHVATVADLAPGETYSRELGGHPYTIAAILPARADAWGRPVYYLDHETAPSKLLLGTDQVWRNN